MIRWAVARLALAIVAGCETPVDKPPVPPAWVYPPGGTVWPLGAPTSVIGREQAPQAVVEAGLLGDAQGPLRLPTVWQMRPGREFEPYAVVYGMLDGKHAVELVDIDTGQVEWRDAKSCKGPVVGVSGGNTVCANGQSIAVLDLDGKLAWELDDAGYISMHGESISGPTSEVVLLRSGSLAVFDLTSGDEVARLKLPAGVAADSIIASCGGTEPGHDLLAYGQDGRLLRIADGQTKWAVPLPRVIDIDACMFDTIVVTVESGRATALVTLERDTGKQLGRVDGVLGHWDSRDGTTDIEVSTVAGVRRFERELDGPGVMLESLRFGELLASRRDLRLVRATATTAVLLDKNGVRAYLPLPELGAAIGDKALVASSWIGDPNETVHRVLYPERYRRALRFPIGGARHIGVPADLRDLPPLTPLAHRAADDAVVEDVKARGWLTDQADAPPHTTAHVTINSTPLIVEYERGRVVAKLPRVQMVPAWSVKVNGVVTQIEAAGDGVLVVLEDGDAYRIDARTGVATALAGIGGQWRVLGDLLVNAGEGGPIPPATWPPARAAGDKPKPVKKATAKKKAGPADDAQPPRLMMPIPPPSDLRPSYQLTLYALNGELRARNDYALAAPVTPGRRAAGAPVVIESGGEAREALVLDPASGDPVRRFPLPPEVIPGTTFSTVVDGKPVVGALAANPLRLLLF